MNGLCKDLQVKVLCEMPNTFCEAIQIARLRYRRLMYKTYGIEVKLPRWEPKRFEAITRDFPNMVTTRATMKDSQAQSVPISINELFSKPLEEVECIKEVHMEEASKVAKKRSCDPMNEGTSELDFTTKMAAPRSKKKAIRQSPQESGFPLKASVSGSKGEG